MKKIIIPTTLLAVVGLYYFNAESIDSPSDAVVTENHASNTTSKQTVTTAALSTSNTMVPAEKTSSEKTATPHSQDHENNEKLTAANAAEQTRQRIAQLVDNTMDSQGKVNLDKVSEVLNVTDFSWVMAKLKDGNTVKDTNEAIDIEQQLAKTATLASYQYDVACNDGLCAVSLDGIVGDDLNKVLEKLDTLKLGSTFQKVYQQNDFENQIRVLARNTPRIQTVVSGTEISFGN